MGESLIYSWLRHIKGCQLVQTNWKPSPSWKIHDEEGLEKLFDATRHHFKSVRGYDVFKNSSCSQLIKQAEIDVLGISSGDQSFDVYAVDVAFHESGLNYGSKKETIERVIKKLARAAICVSGFFDISNGKHIFGKLIFASPKIQDSLIGDLELCVADLNDLLHNNGFCFKAQVLANNAFYKQVMEPILMTSSSVSDTSELFMRAYQLRKMFK